MIEINHCRSDCPNRAEGCHTTCSVGIAETLVNSLASEQIADERREKKNIDHASFKLMFKRNRLKVRER